MLHYVQTLRSRPPCTDWTHAGSGRPLPLAECAVQRPDLWQLLPIAGCQENSGLSGPPKGCGLQAFISWSGDSLDIANSHFQCLLSDLSSDTFSPHLRHRYLPLIPCANLSPFTVFLSFHVPELGDPILTRGRKTNQLCPYQLPATHAQTRHMCASHIHTSMHLFSLPPFSFSFLSTQPPAPTSISQTYLVMLFPYSEPFEDRQPLQGKQ